jgi:ABC-2 type transport system ATP-binding protein
MSGPALDTHGLTKRYGRLLALDALTLRVERGEVFGFLGPNGAGKTTTIRLLLGLIAPSSGTARVLDHDATRGSAWRRQVGYLPGDLALWPRLTGRQTLDMLAHMTGAPPVWREELLARLQLQGADVDRRVRTYSDGMRQKLGIVQALQCLPALVLLDEPTKGLDPLMQIAFYDLIGEATRRGTTVFLSSHVLPEVERVCSRAAMLRGGRLMNVGDIADLRRVLPRRVTISFQHPQASDFSDLGRILASSPVRIELLVAAEDVSALVRRVAGLPIADLLIASQTLEDAFLEQYR